MAQEIKETEIVCSDSEVGSGAGSGRVLILALHRSGQAGLSVEKDKIATIATELMKAGWETELRLFQVEFEFDLEQSVRPEYRSVLLEQLMPRLRSEYLIIIDDYFDVEAGWIEGALQRLVEDRADIVVASRNSRDWAGRIAAMGVERLTGCHAANASAVVVRRSSIMDRLPAIKPAGRWFSLDLQLRVPKERRFLQESHGVKYQKAGEGGRLGAVEISFLKSFIDYKYGNFSRLVQFCMVGFSGMVIDLSCYAMFQTLLKGSELARKRIPVLGSSGDLAVAGFLALALAITWNFVLNRRLTFNDARKNSPIIRQYVTYVLGNALALVVNFAIRLWLPANVAFFDRHKLVAAFVGIVIATAISFNMTRYFVFKSAGKVS